MVGSIYGMFSIKIAHFVPIRGSFGKVASEEKIFWKSTNQKQELSVVAMFVNGRSSIMNAHLIPIRWQTWPP
jgi:hypothetical protein